MYYRIVPTTYYGLLMSYFLNLISDHSRTLKFKPSDQLLITIVLR